MSETMTEKPCAGRVTEAMIDRAVQKSGWFVEPHVAPGGSATEDDLSEAEAAQLNKEMRDELRGILEAALSAQEAAAITLGDEDDVDGLQHALTIAAMGAPFRDYQGNLYMSERYKSDEYRDAEFRDYGLARAARVIFNNAARLAAAIRSRKD